ncbi:MAG: DUF6194 family protein [Pseudomonadota bacterium]
MNDLIVRLSDIFDGLDVRTAYGEKTFYYNPGGTLPRGTYFCTIKDTDGPNDKASALNRPGVWRFNFGLPSARYEALFGPRPARPAKGQTIAGPWPFDTLDRLMPHPIYGWMGWVAIVSPSAASLDILWPDVEAAYEKAVDGFERRTTR